MEQGATCEVQYFNAIPAEGAPLKELQVGRTSKCLPCASRWCVQGN